MEDMIQVRNLKKYFNEVKAVDDISFQVKKGELYGFLGVNGAGKTTTINILCTLLSSSGGDVLVCGKRLGKEDKLIRQRIGVVFQDNTLDDELSVKENLLTRAALYTKDLREIRKNLEYVCEVLEIKELLKRQFGKLSGGQKRRCELAKALMNRPDILFLDEPTTGLDPYTRQLVWESVERLREEGMTVFLTTHYMEEAAKAQYISIIEAGKLVAHGTPASLKERYAQDMIKIVPLEAETFYTDLQEQNIEFEKKSNHIHIKITNSMEGLEILNRLKTNIESFELIQGTMDDVFLNITGKNL